MHKHHRTHWLLYSILLIFVGLIDWFNPFCHYGLIPFGQQGTASLFPKGNEQLAQTGRAFVEIAKAGHRQLLIYPL